MRTKKEWYVMAIQCMLCTTRYGMGDSVFPQAEPMPYDKERRYNCPRCGSKGTNLDVVKR